MDGINGKWKDLPEGWSDDRIAIYALTCAGFLRPGDTPAPDLRGYVGEMMERCTSFRELFAELMPRYPIELQANPDEELTLP